MLGQCVEDLSRAGRQSEFWLVGDDEESAGKYYEALHGHEAALRFDWLCRCGREEAGLDEGRLRQGAVELLLVHHDGNAIAPEDWRSWRRLLVAGGLVMVSHGEGAAIGAGEGWSTLRVASRRTLLQSPQEWPDPAKGAGSPGPRWVLGEPESWAGDWVSLLDEPEVFPIALEPLDSDDVHSLSDWPRAADVQTIDFFCGRNPEDPSGEKVTSSLIAFVRAPGLPSDRARSRALPHDGGDPRSRLRGGRPARLCLVGRASRHGGRGGRGGRNRLPAGGPGRREGPRGAPVARSIRPAGAGAGDPQRPIVGAPGVEHSRSLSRRAGGRRCRLPALPGQPRAVERAADEDERARSPGTGHGRDRREGGGAQLP